MNGKSSELDKKSEYKKVMEDYANNYGYNIGINTYCKRLKADRMDNFKRNSINMKKR